MQIVFQKHRIVFIVSMWMGVWISPTQSFFDSVSLTAPNNNQSSSNHHECCASHHYSPIINNIEVKQTDPLSLQWLYQKASEGPIEELDMVKKNRGFYEQLLKNHIQKLLQKRAANRYFTSNGFIKSVLFGTFFALWSGVVSYPVFKDLYHDHIDTTGHTFPILPALMASFGPLGLAKSFYDIIANKYLSRINERIERDQRLLSRIQAMSGPVFL